MAEIVINGKRYFAPLGSVTVVNNQVFVEGQRIAEDQELKGIVLLRIEGEIGSVQSDISVQCGDVQNNVSASGSVACDNVGGSVTASGSVQCENIGGNVKASGSVRCDDVHGAVSAGGSVACDDCSSVNM